MPTITNPRSEELVVKAAGISADVEARAKAALASVEKSFLDAVEAYKVRKAAAPKAEIAEAIFPTLNWDVLSFGPIQLFPGANPPYDVNKVVASNQAVLMVGISFADPTSPVPTNMYLAGKSCAAKFDLCNVSDCTVGPAPIFTFGPANFSVGTIHVFGAVYVFPPPTGGSTLYESNFSIDISTAGVPGAGFSTHYFDLDSTQGNIFLPAEAPGWRTGENRFLVNQMP